MKFFNTHHFGNSMFPLLQNRDMLEFKETDQYRVGDIVLFESSDKKWIVHRILKVREEFFYTKGDNNLKSDNTLLRNDNILGIVTARWRNGRRLKIARGYLGVLQYQLYVGYFHFRRTVVKIIGQYFLLSKIRNRLEAILPTPTEVMFLKNDKKQKTLYLGSALSQVMPA